MSENFDPLLPPTQSQGSQLSQITTNLLRIPWGRLTACSEELDSVDLVDDTYALGRSPECEIVANNHWLNVSKRHLTIYKGENGIVYIYDHSKNGTYVNGTLVGRGKRNILNTGDVVAIGTPSMKVYIFNDFVDPHGFLPEELKSKYRVDQILGRGACGEVRLCHDKKTCAKFAIKKIIKARNLSNSVLINHPKRINNEINILKSVSHPFIVEMKEVIETNADIFIILEYMPDGDLANYIQSKTLKESEIKFIFYQILQAVQYLHENGITHRDLKPENVLVSMNGPHPHIKLSDFGLSKILSEESMMETTCGTLYYVAPEIINRFGKYSKKVDVWSLGVILYLMLTNELPFIAADQNALAIKILTADIDWSKTVSKYAKDLNKQMLTVNPEKRISVGDIFNHPWIEMDHNMQDRVGALQNERSPPSKRPRLEHSF